MGGKSELGKITNYLDKIIPDLKATYSLNTNEKNILKVLSFFSLLYLIPLVLANSYYIDDVGRFANAGFNWMKDGRPLMQLMAKCLGTGAPYLDIFPLGQLLAVTILNYSLVLWGRKYILVSNSLLAAALLALSYLNLFMLETFSYVFEAIGMIASLSLSIMAYSIFDQVSFIRKFVLTVILVVLSMSFYQASIGAYLGLAAIELCYEFLNKQDQKNILQQFVFRVAGIVGGVAIYIFFVAHPLVKGYGVEHSSTLPFFTESGFQLILKNLNNYYARYQIYLHSLPKVIWILLLFIYAVGSEIILKKIFNKTICRVKKGIYSVVILILPFLLIILSIAPFVLLEKPIFAPRMFLSYTVFFLYIAFLFEQIIQRISYTKILLAPLLLFTLSFSAGYGNLLYRESQHDQFVAQSIAYDLNQLENHDNRTYRKISFIGREPECLELQRQEKKRPLMGLLVPIYMSNDWYWGGRLLDHYRNVAIQLLPKTKLDHHVVKTRKPNIQNEFYNLYAEGDKVIVLFKKIRQ